MNLEISGNIQVAKQRTGNAFGLVKVAGVTYDPEADASYIALTAIHAGDCITTRCVEGATGDINLDFDKENRLIGIEILSASRRLPSEFLDSADRLDGD